MDKYWWISSIQNSIAIWWAGGIGLCAIAAASACGCYPIVAIDINEDKLSLAKKCGATHRIDGRKDPVTTIREVTEGQGTDFGIESAGIIDTMEDGYKATGRFGGHFLIAGNAPHGKKMALHPFDLIAGKKLSGSWGGGASRIRTFHDMRRCTGTAG